MREAKAKSLFMSACVCRLAEWLQARKATKEGKGKQVKAGKSEGKHLKDNKARCPALAGARSLLSARLTCIPMAPSSLRSANLLRLRIELHSRRTHTHTHIYTLSLCHLQFHFNSNPAPGGNLFISLSWKSKCPRSSYRCCCSWPAAAVGNYLRRKTMNETVA